MFEFAILYFSTVYLLCYNKKEKYFHIPIRSEIFCDCFPNSYVEVVVMVNDCAFTSIYDRGLLCCPGEP